IHSRHHMSFHCPYTTLFRSLGVTPATVRKQVELGKVVALHPVSRGPWVLQRDDLDRPEVRQIFLDIRARNNKPEIATSEKENPRSEEHTSELQSRFDLVCRL